MLPDRTLPTLLSSLSVDANVRVIRMPTASVVALRGHAVTSNRTPLTRGLLRLRWPHSARGREAANAILFEGCKLPGSSPPRQREARCVTRKPVPFRLKIYNASGAVAFGIKDNGFAVFLRSEEHTSELQSLMRLSYAVFCLKKKK